MNCCHGHEYEISINADIPLGSEIARELAVSVPNRRLELAPAPDHLCAFIDSTSAWIERSDIWRVVSYQDVIYIEVLE
jgi:hypothetical protein